MGLRRGVTALRIQASVLRAHCLRLVLLAKRRPSLIDPEMLREVMFVVLVLLKTRQIIAHFRDALWVLENPATSRIWMREAA